MSGVAVDSVGTKEGDKDVRYINGGEGREVKVNTLGK